MIIYSVPVNEEENSVSEQIYQQNLSEDLTIAQFGEMFKIRFRSDPRGKAAVNYVVEVDPILRRLLFRQERVFVGFRSLSVRDYIVVTRCSSCQNLGHAAKKEEVCSHCGRAGHRRAERPDKGKTGVCVSCSKRGKSAAMFLQTNG